MNVDRRTFLRLLKTLGASGITADICNGLSAPESLVRWGPLLDDNHNELYRAASRRIMAYLDSRIQELDYTSGQILGSSDTAGVFRVASTECQYDACDPASDTNTSSGLVSAQGTESVNAEEAFAFGGFEAERKVKSPLPGQGLAGELLGIYGYNGSGGRFAGGLVAGGNTGSASPLELFKMTGTELIGSSKGIAREKVQFKGATLEANLLGEGASLSFGTYSSSSSGGYFVSANWHLAVPGVGELGATMGVGLSGNLAEQLFQSIDDLLESAAY